MKDTAALTMLVMLAGSAGLALSEPPPASLAGPLAARLAAPAQQTERFELSGSAIRVSDLAGRIRVEPGRGDRVVVLVKRGGRDADRLEVRADRSAGTLTIGVQGDRLVYPELGRHSHTTVRMSDDGLFEGGRRVRISGSGSGPEAWADLTVQVPAGRQTTVELGAGHVDATDVAADLELRSGSGDLSADGTGGALKARTGSGDVDVTDARGSLDVETGSGDVTVNGVDGGAKVQTGSGDVRISGRVGGSLDAQTGSGDVTADDIQGDRLHVRTGSGGIRVGSARATDVSLHTGSGSVRARLERAPASLRVDTGSGDVQLAVPPSVDADLRIDTGSGSIDLGMPVRMMSSSRSHFRGQMGKGGPEFVIRTGSGDVRLSSSGEAR
ncbi:MAG: DUF4097 family beta strand repeat-containing protein [Candidatus Palauibacterales bacterium]|nr:DUF4097 family beta strand repeat-containing protein [Candidatus Palauibacterales bacterium]MDP2528174.1 DUF4097 family beta strand repeat-containing protein [Candidatus Palauibacterales bacterium]MDP2584665.1 DUF4097 family beta strand repeat-containing protein [Candidatus Palauibacterales bacterium]